MRSKLRFCNTFMPHATPCYAGNPKSWPQKSIVVMRVWMKTSLSTMIPCVQLYCHALNDSHLKYALGDGGTYSVRQNANPNENFKKPLDHDRRYSSLRCFAAFKNKK